MIRLTTYCPNEYTADLVSRFCEALGCSRTVVGVEEEPEAVARVRQEMARPWTELEWTTRTYRCLRDRVRWVRSDGATKQGFQLETVGDLCDKTDSQLLALRGFGRKSLNEVKDRLGEMGLKLREVGR